MKEIIKSQRLGEEFLRIKHKSGLTLLLCPMKGYSSAYALFGTEYGSVESSFIDKDGVLVQIPAGTAHFLEHKMFESEEGDAFALYAKTGASANAYTSFDKTAYLFSCSDNFKESLSILMHLVTEPYFTPQTVEKEQGIIGQEIRMVEDDPDNQVFYGLMECLFDHHPIRVPIAGTQESISHITADTLYACHKAFYTPSNMVLTVAGDVEPEEVVRIAREILPKEPGGHIERDYGGEEDGAAAKPEKELRMEVSTPIFQLGFKAEPAPAGEEHLRRQLMGELACEALLGNSSPLYARLYSEGLINKNFGYGFELYPGCALMAAGGESCDPRAVRDAVLAEGARIAQEGVDEGLFRRLKKGVYGAKVRGLNSFENVCIELAQAHFAGVEYLTFPEVFDGISKADVEDCIRRWVTPERCGLAVVRPGEEA